MGREEITPFGRLEAVRGVHRVKCGCAVGIGQGCIGHEYIYESCLGIRDKEVA